MNETTEYEYKIINSILRKKVKEQAQYIADLEAKLGAPGLKERLFQEKYAAILETARNNKKEKENVRKARPAAPKRNGSIRPKQEK